MIHIRPMVADDCDVVLQIYQEGIDSRQATFTTILPTWEAFDRDHSPLARLVAVEDDRVIGWFALSPHSSREVYRGVAWESIYLASDARGKGIGKLLLSSGISASEQASFWTLQAGVFAENAPSLALHQKLGFRVVGIREKLGKLDGQWRDVVLLERRSPHIW